LVGGLLRGLEDAGWHKAAVLATETIGSNCLQQSLRLNSKTTAPKDVTVARLSTITSQATSLGARSPALKTVQLCLQNNVVAVSVSDEMCMYTACEFAEHEKIMVELACAAALSPLCFPELLREAYPDVFASKILGQQAGTGTFLSSKDRKNIVVIVCGGSKIHIEDLAAWRAQFGKTLDPKFVQYEF